MSDDAAWQKWFEAIWADREDRVYRDYFGELGPGIYTLRPENFAQVGAKNVDPRWLHHGVFECPPAGASSHVRRDHWLYVSSGMSNPWGDSPETAKPEGLSGLGFELTLHTREPGRWALELMQWLMAVQLLVASGELQGAGGGLVEYDDRVKFRQGKDSGGCVAVAGGAADGGVDGVSGEFSAGVGAGGGERPGGDQRASGGVCAVAESGGAGDVAAAS